MKPASEEASGLPSISDFLEMALTTDKGMVRLSVDFGNVIGAADGVEGFVGGANGSDGEAPAPGSAFLARILTAVRSDVRAFSDDFAATPIWGAGGCGTI